VRDHGRRPFVAVQDAEDLIALTRDIADKVLDPIVDAHEKAETYPEGVFSQLGAAGLLSLPQPEEWVAAASPTRSICRCSRRSRRGGRGGGGGQRAQPVVAPVVDVRYRRAEAALAAGDAVGEEIGAYSLSEPQAGSDAAALRCAATKADGGYVLNGSKSWITHGGRADFYTLFARTGEGSRESRAS